MLVVINKNQRYDTYKNSELDWVKEVPEHWKRKKVFHFFKAEKGKRAAILTKEFCGGIKGNYPVYSGQTKNNGIMSSINEFEFDYSLDGCLFTTTVGAKAMTVSFLQGKFSLSQNCMIIVKRNNEIDNKYIYYQFQPLFAYYRNQIPDHMQASFRMDDLYQYRFLVPPLKEQIKIAQFLDNKTTKIEDAIAIKEQQIQLLKERKQILIHKAVTIGLNPNVKLKNSGVEWIGKIPEHWELSRLGLMLKPYSVKNRPNETLLSITRELGVIERDLEDLESNHNFIPEDLSGYKLIEKGDFGMNKMKAWQGSYGVSKFTGIVSPAYYTFKLVDSISTDFFHFAIRSKIYVPFFGKASDGVRIGQWDLSKERMKRIPFVVPTLDEQEEILEYIDSISLKIETAISLKQQEIEKLKEYKSSLINSVVTGKVKVC